MIKPCSKIYYISLFVILLFLTTRVNSSVLVETIPTFPNDTSIYKDDCRDNKPSLIETSNKSYHYEPNDTGITYSVGTIISYSDFSSYLNVFHMYDRYDFYCVTHENFQITMTSVPDCSLLLQPINNNTNVSVDTNLTWLPVPNTTGYKLTIGTTPSGTDILNVFDVGNTISYNPPVDLPENTLIYVNITPYNVDGDAISCTEEYFTTESKTLNCTNLTQPSDLTTNISVNTDLTWGAVPNATGYKLSIGTISGVSDILNEFDVGNNINYSISGSLPANASIYVTITPYNADGDTNACPEEAFMTGSSILTPNCTTLSIPVDGNIDIPFTTDLTWLTIFAATGYKLTVGTTSRGTDILNDFDIGKTNSYNLPNNLPGNTRIFVSITPYNSFGNTVDCTEESFTTGAIIPVPECTNLLMPMAGKSQVPVGTDLEWKPVLEATGYILKLETFTNNIDVLNRFDVGNITNYNIAADLPENTRIYITITPYNLAGEAIGCIEEIFTTGDAGIHIPPKFFTPNNDGINDFWVTPNPINRISTVFIYNRQGKLLKEINNIARGWDGTSNSYPLPTNDYWYQIVYNDGATYTGHFSLKR